MKIGAIIQARTSSTRLPAKVLKNLPYNSEITVLEQVIRRLKKSDKLNEIVIATTHDKEDHILTTIADKENVKWSKGSKENVLERYYNAAVENNLDIIVRICSDCPCIDPQVIDLLIDEHISSGSDYTNNTIERSFPHGLDAEVVSFTALSKTYNEATQDYEKEHVLEYIVSTKPELFKITNFKAPDNLYAPDIRITLDTEEDYALLCAIFDNLYSENNFFTAFDLIKLFKEKPWLKLINKKILQKKIFDNFDEELKESLKILDLQELKNVKEFLEKQF